MKALRAKNANPYQGKWGKIVRDVGVFEFPMPDLFADECTVQDIEGYFNVKVDMEIFELITVDVVEI